MNIALLSNVNIDHLHSSLKSDFQQFYASGYAQYLQELSRNDSFLLTHDFDVVVILLDGDEFLKDCIQSPVSLDKSLKTLAPRMEMLFKCIENYSLIKPDSLIMISTIAISPVTPMRYLERNSPFSLVELKERFNANISQFAQKHANCLVLDWDRNVSKHGYINLHDARFWYLGRIKHTNLACCVLSTEIRNLIKAHHGKIKKVLVVDLDNTLWGGVLGEDGISGIILSEEGVGKAYADFQRLLLAAKNIGILLAVCSKNNLSDVLEAFEQHPTMILQMHDFSSVRINWQDKAANLHSIAEELNIALDAFVFIDDNVTERELVRKLLPEVAVPEFPAELADLSRWIAEEVILTFFPKVSLTEEDQFRTNQYHANTQRKELASRFDFDDFLRDLNISLSLRINDHALIDRALQMIQKTNQFNLTTRRYSKSDIEVFMQSPEWDIFNLQYEDRLGKEGIVGTAIVRYYETSAIIDSFLLSCRVIGRKIEYDFLSFIIDWILTNRPGVEILQAEYIETSRNSIAADFYASAGFKGMERCAGESTLYTGTMYEKHLS